MNGNQKVKEQLLETARKAFLERGYKDVSMRYIARMSGMALSNIYYYFKSKDELFTTILIPAITQIKRPLIKHNCETGINIDIFAIYKENITSNTVMEELSSFINNYGDEAYVLLFKAQGSSLEFFTEELTQNISDMSLEYFEKMKLKYPNININISPFFIHVYISCWITTLKEMVSHRNIWKKERHRYLKDLKIFILSGWKELMRV